MPSGAHVVALRWGAAEIPLDLRVDGGSPAAAVQAILAAAQRSLGPAAACYAGQGALVIERKEGIGDGVP
jgi:hypothetical protein